MHCLKICLNLPVGPALPSTFKCKARISWTTIRLVCKMIFTNINLCNKVAKCHFVARERKLPSRSVAEFELFPRVTMTLLTHFTYTQDISYDCYGKHAIGLLKLFVSILFSKIWGYNRFTILLLHWRCQSNRVNSRN